MKDYSVDTVQAVHLFWVFHVLEEELEYQTFLLAAYVQV